MHSVDLLTGNVIEVHIDNIALLLLLLLLSVQLFLVSFTIIVVIAITVAGHMRSIEFNCCCQHDSHSSGNWSNNSNKSNKSNNSRITSECILPKAVSVTLLRQRLTTGIKKWKNALSAAIFSHNPDTNTHTHTHAR